MAEFRDAILLYAGQDRRGFMRLDKYLAEMLYGTRSGIKKITSSGRVSVNGSIIKTPGFKINETSDIVCVDGKEISYSRYVYYMLNKPAGVVSATKDNVHKTVTGLVKETMAVSGDNTRAGIFPVGRLDIDTEGLLLVTNDGAMAHKLLSPRKHTGKTYFVVAEGKLGDRPIKQLKEGMDIGDGRLTLPAVVENVAYRTMEELDSHIKTVITGNCSIPGLQTSTVTTMELTLYEGRYHQVKRMVAAAGSHVLYLKRIRMGSLELDANLLPGECRQLSGEEIALLRQCLEKS